MIARLLDWIADRLLDRLDLRANNLIKAQAALIAELEHGNALRDQETEIWRLTAEGQLELIDGLLQVNRNFLDEMPATDPRKAEMEDAFQDACLAAYRAKVAIKGIPVG